MHRITAGLISFTSGNQLTINTIGRRSMRSFEKNVAELFSKKCKTCSAILLLIHKQKANMNLITQSLCFTFSSGTYSPGLHIFLTIHDTTYKERGIG